MVSFDLMGNGNGNHCFKQNNGNGNGNLVFILQLSSIVLMCKRLQLY